MASYITLELDTTSPTVEIYAPNNTTVNTDTFYTISANEPLLNIQEFYFLDAKKQRHDVTLKYTGNGFEGIISYNNFAEGMATFVVQVYDEVMNKSKRYAHNINVEETRDMKLELEMTPRQLAIKHTERKVDLIHQDRVVKVSLSPRKLDFDIEEISGMEENN
jgi:hypothetical protein